MVLSIKLRKQEQNWASYEGILYFFTSPPTMPSPALSQTFGNSWYIPPLTEASSRKALVLLGKLGYSHRICIDAY
jgi:hypothetical protein